MARNLPDFGEFVEAKKAFEKHVNTLHAQLSEQFTHGTLAADTVLADLLPAATSVDITDEIVEAARRRAEVGNPPGKKGSLGDALNWEALLRQCPEVEMHLVTGDADFVSKMSNDKVSSYLADEWARSKKSEIHLHRRIGSFLADQFPHIKVASEYEKQRRIEHLARSRSFQNTHNAIAALSQYTDFSEEQAELLLRAAANNDQIWRIGDDPDVREFFLDLDRRYGSVLDADARDEFDAWFKRPDDREHDDAPI